MFTLKMKTGLVFDLENVLGSIPPKDIPTLKEMSMIKKLRTKLQESTKALSELIGGLQDTMKPLRDAKASDDELNAAAKPLLDVINAKRVEDLEVELSDEQIECFRRWFRSFIRPKMLQADMCLMAAESLGIDVDAE